MSLVEVKSSQIIGKQVKYKLKTNMGIFTSLIILQIIAILVSFGGASGGIRGNSFEINIEYHYHTIDYISLFIMIWAFMVGIILPRLMNEEATFIATFQTSTLSNLIYTLIISFIAGVTTVFASYLQKIILTIFDIELMDIGFSLFSNPMLFIGTIYVHVLYYFLICSLGYLFGTIMKYSKLLLIVVIATIFGIILLEGLNQKATILVHVISFYYDEPLMIIFFMKILLTAIVLYSLSYVLNKQMEVRY